ncbi:hypothetical protein LMG33810_002045 [Carnimonas sp. LMG 33810]
MLQKQLFKEAATALYYSGRVNHRGEYNCPLLTREIKRTSEASEHLLTGKPLGHCWRYRQPAKRAKAAFWPL